MPEKITEEPKGLEKVDLAPVEEAIKQYREPSIEMEGRDVFEELKATIERHGEPAYTLLCKEFPSGEPISGQMEWYLFQGAQKWLNSDNVQYLIGRELVDPNSNVEKFGAVVLANRWNIAKQAIGTKIEETNKILQKSIKDRNHDRYERTHEQKLGGHRGVEMLTTTLALAFIKSESWDEQKSILQHIDTLDSYDLMRTNVAIGLDRALYLSEDRDVFNMSKGTWGAWEKKKPPYGLELERTSEKVKANRQKLKDIFNIRGEDDREKRGEEKTTGHRNIISGEFEDQRTGKTISSIIKVCEKITAEREKKNFEIIKSWGLPTPEVLELTEDGIRVEDLSENGKKRFRMGDTFNSLEDLLEITSNSRELRGELEKYLEILKVKGVSNVNTKDSNMIRAVGIAMDPETRKGKLYFADVDHLNLPEEK